MLHCRLTLDNEGQAHWTGRIRGLSAAWRGGAEDLPGQEASPLQTNKIDDFCKSLTRPVSQTNVQLSRSILSTRLANALMRDRWDLILALP
jgi:hypothetical protein